MNGYLEKINSFIEENGSRAFRINQIGYIFSNDQKDFLHVSNAYDGASGLSSKNMLIRRIYEYSDSRFVNNIIEKEASIDFLVLSEAAELLKTKIIGENPNAEDVKHRFDSYTELFNYDGHELEKYLIKTIAEFSALLTFHAYEDINRESRKSNEIELFKRRGKVEIPESNEGVFYSKYDLHIAAEHIVPAAEYEKCFAGFEDRLGYIKRVDDLVALHFGIIISDTIEDSILRNEAREILSNPFISIDDSLYNAISRTVVDFYKGDNK